MAAFATGQAGFQEHRERQVDVVAAQQDVLADRDPPYVGDGARCAGAQLEQAEVGGAAADIDHQHMAGAAVRARP